MWGKYAAQIILAGARLVGRAFGQALKEEYATSQQYAKARQGQSSTTNDSKADFITGMTLEEAKNILNVKDIHNPNIMSKNFEYLFKVNDKKVGGSLYLQSKVK
ncbi:unnamed protein product [Protopolystoma xenopodis]|uniref:Presequence translocated-associated motor subunit PAM16 n=1 Tax=Protopolystoma xenopodis TaxID=117903 RepID=A0A448XSH1_9PLAT|nr:unnamed protein product [Protopolystoma xenopodis]